MLPEDVFPYPSFRAGQKELAGSVYLACKNGQRFVAEAMSGFGKTAAVLAGAVAAAVDEDLDIVYACRTKRQVHRALEELNRFSGRVSLRATSLFSKYDYCLLRRGRSISPETFKWYCSFHTSNNLCSYFLNTTLNQGKIEDFLQGYTGRAGTHSELLDEGTKLHVCPYEIARLSVARSSIVVTTYHYLLDEGSRGILIPGDRPLSDTVAIVDEAHNIRDFMSDVSTTSLTLADLRGSAKESHSFYLPQVCEAITEVSDRMDEFWKKETDWLVGKESLVAAATGTHPKDWLPSLVVELSANAKVAWFSVATGQDLPPSLARLGTFLAALLASMSSDHISLVRSEQSFSLIDGDPARRFRSATAGFRSLVLLSATINPPGLFLRSIGLDETSTVLHSATSGLGFRIKTVIDCGVTTRFKMRTPEMLQQVVGRVAAIIRNTPRGVGVFFPSYSYLGSVRETLVSALPKTTVLVERPDLSNEASEGIMRTVRSERSVLLAVQGGRFSEGEDFSGDVMDVTIVVGLPLPPPSPTLFAGYEELERQGFKPHEAYMVLSLLPALRKAFQAAGRHVRSPGKVGMVFLLDRRFGEQKVVDLMPTWLTQDVMKANADPQTVAALVHDFFSRAG